jgi:hypothetical protein
MNIEETKRIANRRHVLPLIKTGGRWYLIETKPSLLDAGIASMIAVVADGYDFKTNFANPSQFTAVLPADPADGRPDASVIPDATRDPAVVALARKFALTGTF